MKLTHVEKSGKTKRFNFKSYGYFSFMDINSETKEVLDSSYRKDSEPYQKQLREVEKYYK